MTDRAGFDLSADIAEGETVVTLRGRATLAEASALAARLDDVPASGGLRYDLSGLERLDTAGAYALLQAEAKQGVTAQYDGMRPEISALLAQVRKARPKVEEIAPPDRTLTDRVEGVGRVVVGAFSALLDGLAYFGVFLARLGRSILRPSEFRLTALVHHCQEVGLKAVPIVAVMAFLIGVVLAFQGSAQLRQFGAEVFVVDLIAISILRELGILLTAIIVAGRTASAFTAAIGSMKMREEIDAMRTLAIDPAAALFVPRILALVITLPILGLIANVAGLLGGALMSWVELGISPAMFQTRLLEGTDIRHVMVGLVKAPVFALLIGVIGCRAGMRVGSSAESLGTMTSSAVVAAIFAVIVADAAFSVFFAAIGV